MEHDRIRERAREARDQARRIRADGQDGPEPKVGRVAAWVRRDASEVFAAHALLDELGVARSAPDSSVDYLLADRIQLLVDSQAAG